MWPRPGSRRAFDLVCRVRYHPGMPSSPTPALAGARGASRSDRAAHREGVVLLATVVLAWGLTWPVNKALLEQLSPLWMLSLRSAIGTVALFAIAIARRRL